MTRGRATAAALAALALYGALLALSAPSGPDDWDGIGFLASVRDFDMAAFRPHPPGYPVYVALLRAASAVTRTPMRGAIAVAVASAVAGAALVGRGVASALGARAGVVAAVAWAATPLAWRAGTGVGSEGPALALVALALWGLVAARTDRPRGGAVALGLGVGLGLGVRLSWAPLDLVLLALAPRGARARACVAAALGAVAWAVPLVGTVGPSRLAVLYADHLSGHASRWGGTVVTDPGLVRLRWLARDVFVDGLGVDADALGLAIAVTGLGAMVLAARAWRAAGWRGAGVAAAAVSPYLIWVTLGQNLRDQPRHALPLVVLLAVSLGVGAATTARGLAVAALLGALVTVRSARDAIARRDDPPAAAQLVDLVRAQPDPDRVAVFGTTSVRFFEGTELAGHAFPAATLGDVQVRLTRMPALPTCVWITDEVGREASRWPLEPVATLCRPARVDRRKPCLDVVRWRLPYLPAAP